MKILQNTLVSKCSECDAFDDHDQDEWGNYVNRPHCTETGDTVNPDVIDENCSLQDCITFEKNEPLIKVFFKNLIWESVDKVIIVKKKEEKIK